MGLQMNHGSDKQSYCPNVECRYAGKNASHHLYVMEVALIGTWTVAELIGNCIGVTGLI